MQLFRKNSLPFPSLTTSKDYSGVSETSGRVPLPDYPTTADVHHKGRRGLHNRVSLTWDSSLFSVGLRWRRTCFSKKYSSSLKPTTLYGHTTVAFEGECDIDGKQGCVAGVTQEAVRSRSIVVAQSSTDQPTTQLSFPSSREIGPLNQLVNDIGAHDTLRAP